MSENAFFAAFFIPAAAVVLVFLMKYVASVLQVRVRLAQDDVYRAVALQAAQAQADTAAALAAQGALLATIQGQLASLEQILKQVE